MKPSCSLIIALLLVFALASLASANEVRRVAAESSGAAFAINRNTPERKPDQSGVAIPQIDKEIPVSKPNPKPSPVAGTPRPELVVATGHGSAVSALAFSPDGRLLATGSGGESEGSIKLWDVKSGMGLRTLTKVIFLGSNSSGVSALAFSPDGKILASAIVKSTATQDPQATFTMTTEVAFWDITNGNKLNTIESRAEVLAIAFSPNGRFLAAGNKDRTVTIWEPGNGQVWKTLGGHPDEVNFVLFTSDGSRLSSGSWARGLKLWDVTTSTVAEEFGGIAQLANSKNQVAVVAFNQATRKFAVETGLDLFLNEVSLIDRASLTVERKFKLEAGVSAIAFDVSGHTIAIGTSSGSIDVLNVETGVPLVRIKPGQSIDAMALSPDSRVVAQSRWFGDHSIKLWDISNETEMKTLVGHTDEINSLAFSVDSKILASASDDKTVKLWDIESGGSRTLKGHTDQVGMVVFSPDGHMLASIADNGGEDDEDVIDRGIRLWDVAAGRALKTLSTGASAPVSIAFSPDGKILAAGNLNRTVSLVDVRTGRVLKTLAGHNGEVVSVIFLGAETLQSISGDEDDNYQTYLWSLPRGTLIKSQKESETSVTFIGNGIPTFAISEELYAFSLENNGVALFRNRAGRLIDPKSQTEVARLFLFDDNDWLLTTPEGFFEGSPGAWKHALWRFNNDTFDYGPIELYFNDFFYPNLLQDILAGKTPQPHAGRELARIDRRQPKVSFLRGNGESETGADSPQLESDQRLRNVAIEVTDNTEPPKQDGQPATSGMQDLRLFRNGSLVHTWSGDLSTLEEKEGCERLAPKTGSRAVSVRCQAQIPIISGDNRLTAYAFNHDNVKSDDASLTLKGGENLKRKGTLYVLAVGINKYSNPNYLLRYSVADAQAFGAEIARQQSQLGRYDRGEVVSLLDEAATKANILLAMSQLTSAALRTGAPALFEKLKPAQPEDAVIIYFAGHGTAVQQRFYLVPHDVGYQGSRTELDKAALQTILSHSISDIEIERAVRGIDAETFLMVLDACNSGQALDAEEKRRGPMNSKGLAQLAYEKGMSILTAAQSYQAALESSRVGHGYLTYALVEEGLKTVKADTAPQDGLLTEREWLNFATRRVPVLLAADAKSASLAQPVSGRVLRREKSQFKTSEPELQRPRVFYRREVEANPWIVGRPGQP